MAIDLGIDPDDSRGVALDEPTTKDSGPEAKELPEDPQKEVTAEGQEIAEGQTEDAGEAQTSPDGSEEESKDTKGEIEDAKAEGHARKLKAKEFADQAGWSLEEFYRDVVVPTDDGEATLSEVVDGYKSLRAENERLQTERQELESRVTEHQPMQPYSPEAVKLMGEVQTLQAQYDKAMADGTFDAMEAAEAMRLQGKYRDAIDQRVRVAQEKQAAHKDELDVKMREYQAKVDVQLRQDIPEFRNPDIKNDQLGAIHDMLKLEYKVDEGRWEGIKMDPFSMKLIHDLWSMKKKEASVLKAVKKVEKVPRAMAPTSRLGTGKLKSISEVGAAISNAKSRRAIDKILLETEFDDSLLG